MSRISVWKATDGRIFEDRAVYRKHQAFLDLVKWLLEHSSAECSSVLDARAMVERRDELAKLLKHAEEAP